MAAYYQQPYDNDQDIWGTVITKGVRTGAAATSSTDLASNGGLDRSNFLDQFGAGAYQSPLIVYRINPAPETSAGGSIVQPINVSEINAFPYRLNLSGSTIGTKRAVQKYISGYDAAGNPEYSILMDYPRCVAFNLSADLPENVGITVLVEGTDYYNQPLVSSANITIGNQDQDTIYRNVYTPSAFRIVNKIWISEIVGEVPADITLQALAGDVFGLPYSLSQVGHVIWYSQSDSQWENYAQGFPFNVGGSLQQEVSYIWPAQTGEGAPFGIIPYQVGMPQYLTCAFSAGDGIVSASTCDVRGLVGPNKYSRHDIQGDENPLTTNIVNVVAGQTESPWTNASDSYITLVYYCAGFDNNITQNEAIQNQMMQQAFKYNPTDLFDDMWQSVLPVPSARGGKGVQPYYIKPPV